MEPTSPMVEENEDIELCLQGTKLYGDDFTPGQLAAWFAAEEQAYYRMATADGEYVYGYHALNRRHGFRWLGKGPLGHVLAMGGALGKELYPVLRRLSRITIVDPGRFDTEKLEGMRIDRTRPRADGRLPFPDGAFDLVTCLGTLHHVPNVSTVLGEIFRCLKPGGYALVREPVVSMGDWRRPRPGLTPRERGIPLALFRESIRRAGFTIVRERKCIFAPLAALIRLSRRQLLNSRLVVWMDEWICRIPVWPSQYHTTKTWKKFRPHAVYYVLRRDGSCEAGKSERPAEEWEAPRQGPRSMSQ